MRFIGKYFISLLCAAVIVLLCFLNPRNIDLDLPKIVGLDKIAHFLMYFGWTALIVWESFNRRPSTIDLSLSRPLFWTALLSSCLFGGIIEFLQGLTGYRGMDHADLVADVLGALMAYLFYYVIAMYRQNKSQS